MAHALPLPIPCPVKLGSVKGDSLEAQLHEYVRRGDYVKVKRLLKKGVFVDAVNSSGQTSLFIAALLGLGKIVEVLLDYGSNANHRCSDGSTPVHAAAFSGNQWILSKLLDAGGDLRVHDAGGRNPQCWALSAEKGSSAQMLEFIQHCTFHMQAAIQHLPSGLLRQVASSKAQLQCPSRFGGLVKGNAGSPLGRLLKGGANAAKNIYSFGFGKFCLAGSGHIGYLASLPIIGEKDVVQADDEPLFSYSVGPYMIMTNLLWGGSRVTVKELSFEPHQNCRKLHLADLLLAEQEHSSKLHHPHLQQLLAVCLSSDLQKTRLVYERVNFCSLYSILHEKLAELPVLQELRVVQMLLQISDALSFLHSRGFLHRSLSSYAIQIVSAAEAKLCNLEYMIESKDGGAHSDLTRVPVPAQLYKWCSPEVILGKAVTVKSDLYSFCAVVQEALTGTLPWKDFEGSLIKQLILSGQQLEADVRLPMPYYELIKSGLEPKQENRSLKLQDIQYTLKKDIKDLAKSETCCAKGMAKAQRHSVSADVDIHWAPHCSYQKRREALQGKELSEAGSSTASRYSVFPEEDSASVHQEASSSLESDAEGKSGARASEVQTSLSGSDVDDSLCSFEINEMFASCSELPEDFLGEGARSGQTLKDEDPHASCGLHCEENSVYEEDGLSELSPEYTTEEEERLSEASDLCMLAQGRGDAGRRVSSLPQDEQLISRAVLNVKILQSFSQQAAGSLCRIGEKLGGLEASKEPKKLPQKSRMSQHSKEICQERHWNRAEDTSQNTTEGNSSCWQAVGPPSADYVPPLLTSQAQGALDADNFQAVSKTAKEMETIQTDKWKCFPEVSESKTENHHALSLRVGKNLDDQWSLEHETAHLAATRMPDMLNHALLDSSQHLLPHGSGRCKKKFNLQHQRGGESDSSASGRSEEERWSCEKSRPEIPSTKSREERRLMQSEWRIEVKEMARRVASGQLELGHSYLASECTSESEAESGQEACQHVTLRAPKHQDQQRYRWQTGADSEPWTLGSEHRSEPEQSALQSVLTSAAGRSCQSPAQEEQAESAVAMQKNSVFPQQAVNLSRGPSRDLQCCLLPSPEVSEEFLTPDYFLPPTTEGSAELESSDAEGKLDGEGLLQKEFAEGAGSSAEGSGGKTVSCSTAAQKCGRSTPGVNQLHQMPVASVEAAQEGILWEPQEECKEKDVSARALEDFSSICCEEENWCRAVECQTPRVRHAPVRVSTPLSSENIPITFEKYRGYHEVVSDASFGGSQDISTVCRTFTTACEEERCTQIPSGTSAVCSSELNEPDGLPGVAPSLRGPRKASALSQASKPFPEELPAPAQELLDEIEYLKLQDFITQGLQEKELPDCRVQRNVPDQITMEDREWRKESERNEERNQSFWSKESFYLAEETERAHSTLDEVLERMLHAVPGDEEIPEQAQGHTFGRIVLDQRSPV